MNGARETEKGLPCLLYISCMLEEERLCFGSTAKSTTLVNLHKESRENETKHTKFEKMQKSY